MSVNNLMLVSLSISAWSAKKYDKKISAKVAADHGAPENAGRYNKNLLPFEADSYLAVHAAISKSRDDYYRETMPWLDDGWRALPSMNHLTFSELMRANREAVDDAGSAFRAEAPALFQRAKMVLGSMWRAEDYPDPFKLKNKFSFSLRFQPVPDASDFRVTELAETDVQAIREQIEADKQAGVKVAIGELYERLNQVVEHMKGRLKGEKVCHCRACKGREFKTDQFNDSLVLNVREVCEVLPRLNFTEDAELERYRQEVLTGLTQFAPEILRENEAVRTVVAERAEQIQSDMAAFMQAA